MARGLFDDLPPDDPPSRRETPGSAPSGRPSAGSSTTRRLSGAPSSAPRSPEPLSQARPPVEPTARRRIFTVTELNVGIRDLLEEAFPEFWVEGELSNCKTWTTGHLYFTLKDQNAQIKGVMFRSSLRYLKFKPADGLHVVARGKVSVYEPKGEYQLVCEHMEPQGLGALQLAFEQLKRRLHAEGLFDESRKRPLPALPRKIGVVTSIDGAAVRDIITVLRRRHANAQIVVRPTRVQGEGAAAEIARAMRAIALVDAVDVIIVGRGGGSLEDLWAFNEEAVARAIADCPVPVISAVGHETDFTIADFVADLRAPTPSAAAEVVVKAWDALSSNVTQLRGRLLGAVRANVLEQRRLVHSIERRPAFGGIPTHVAMRSRHAAELSRSLDDALQRVLGAAARRTDHSTRRLDLFHPGRRIAGLQRQVGSASARLHAAAGRVQQRARTVLQTNASRLDALSPLAVLGRGYAVCWNADRTRIIKQASDTAVGDTVRVTLADGEIECDVRNRTT